MCECPNILMCVCLQKFEVCLVDFNTVSRINLTPQSALQGTVPYMSPQACRVSVHCDVCVRVSCVSLYTSSLNPHEVEPWFHSWYRETLDAKY